MRQPRGHPTLRHGLPAAVVIAALGTANAVIQARRHAIGPSARGLVVFSYLFLLIVVLLLLAVGFRAARSTGRARAGAGAGALALGLPCAVFLLVVTLQALPHQGTLGGARIVGYVIAFLLFAGAGAAAGGVVSMPAALVARARYRDEHAEELAALAAARAAEKRLVAVRRKAKQQDDMSWPVAWLVIAAIMVVAIAPAFAAQWAYNGFTQWQGFLVASGALVLGIALMKSAARHRRLGYVLDCLGLTSLCFAAMLATAELTGLGIALISTAGAMIYTWRFAARFGSDDSSPPAETSEREPVLFRYDGQAIVVYPSRRTLALHAAFAGGVAVVAGALAVLFRGGGPVPVFSFGAFALMGLIGFVPDVVRLLHRWPALIVSSDGVTDLASAHLIGFGLIPWHEIVGVINAGHLRGSPISELAILPVSFHRLLARQPLLKRPFLRFTSAMGGGAIYLSAIILSRPPSELALSIFEFVKSHAPAGYVEPDQPDEEAGIAGHEEP